jgi:hypothetical protein
MQEKAIYEKHKTKPFPTASAQTIRKTGKMVLGVMLDEAEGFPAGCWTIDRIEEMGVARDAELANTEEALDDIQYERVWGTAQARMATKAVPKDDGTVVLRSAPANPGHDSGDDYACMEAVWGGAMTSGRITAKDKRAFDAAEGDVGEEVAKGTKKIKVEPTVPKAKAKTAAKTKHSGSAASSPMAFGTSVSIGKGGRSQKKEEAKMAKELDKSDAVLLSFDQMKASLGQDATLIRLTRSAMLAQQGKLLARLHMVHVHSKGWVDSMTDDQRRGMGILQKLNDASQHVKLMLPLLAALQDHNSKPAELHGLICATEDVGIKVALFARKLLHARVSQDRVANNDWPGYFKLLDPNDETLEYGLSSMKTCCVSTDAFAELASEIHSSSVLKVVDGLLRVTDTAENPLASKQASQGILDFTTAAMACNVVWTAMPDEVKADVRRLIVLVKATLSDEATDANLNMQLLDVATKELLQNKSGVFFWALTCFHTGQTLTNRSVAIVRCSLQDKALAADLDAALDVAKAMKDAPVDLILKEDGEIAVPNQARYITVNVVADDGDVGCRCQCVCQK